MCDKKRLQTHYERLTATGGGQGVGVGWVGGCVKGVKLGEEACADATLEAIRDGLGPVLFHTRIATSGAVDDYYCHPFPVGADGWLIHNGCWDHEQARWSLLGGGADVDEVVCANDSQTAALLVECFGEKALYMIDSGVFVVQQGGVVNVYVLSGDFAGWKDEEGNWWYASSPPSWAIEPQTFTRGTVAELRADGPVIKFGKLSTFLPPTVYKTTGLYGGKSMGPITVGEFEKLVDRGKKKKKNRWLADEYDDTDDYFKNDFSGHTSDDPVTCLPMPDPFDVYNEVGKIADDAMEKAISGEPLTTTEQQALWELYEMTEEDFGYTPKKKDDGDDGCTV